MKELTINIQKQGGYQIMSLKAITTVYSYRHPETRRTVDNVLIGGFPHHVFLRATNPPGALDAFDQPIIDKVVQFNQDSVPHMREFPFRYPTAGSEEGIREVMTDLQAKGVKKIHVLNGEYEGFQAVADQRCIETVEVDPNTDFTKMRPGYFFISNPSARDGNIIPNDFINTICDAGHKVFYDLAYLGSTKPHKFDVRHQNIFAAVISFSKTYGLFYDRIGFAFSREAVPSLYGNKWFKSIFALMIAEAIVSELNPNEIPEKYKPVQKEIIADINAEHGLGMKPSDAFLLGHITAEHADTLNDSQMKMIEKFKRGNFFRFCLTPYFVERDPELVKLTG
jgi:histidinol-phosphate/aromatic aminotransferase/cobyric acid decarboxylase-like protein